MDGKTMTDKPDGKRTGWRVPLWLLAAALLYPLSFGPACWIASRNAWMVPAVEAAYRGEVAKRWRYADGGGEIGVIASVTQPFCGDCTRARLSADGKLYTCLFAVRGHDLRALVRDGAGDAQLEKAIADIWSRRTDRYSELRSANTAGLPKIEMSYIGG